MNLLSPIASSHSLISHHLYPHNNNNNNNNNIHPSSHLKSLSSILSFRPEFDCSPLFPPTNNPNFTRKGRRSDCLVVRATRRESPYDVLGVSPSATSSEIKSAYRKLALKFHPDVNKQANAQEKFLRIKHAYNTLMNSESRRRYDDGSRTSGSSNSRAGRNQSNQEEEDFYGFGDFLKDLQEEYRNWEASATSQGKPMSLWEELAEIGEDFVEFLEKELNITDQEETNDKEIENSFQAKTKGGQANNGNGIEESIDEIEATLAKLKKELGL